MIEAIISGIGFGLVLTFITGPVFFALIKTSIEKGFHAGLSLALGVVTSDMVFVGAILFGSQYWRGLLAWLTSTMLNERNINAEDLSLMHLTDSPKDAVDFIIKCCGFDENADGKADLIN